MPQKLIIRHNGEAVIEYDRLKALPARQMEYLDKMDQSMDRGLRIGEQEIDEPSDQQRLEFVAGQLYQALINENDGMIAAMCAYIAVREPKSSELLFKDADGNVSIELMMTDDDDMPLNSVMVKFDA